MGEQACLPGTLRAVDDPERIVFRLQVFDDGSCGFFLPRVRQRPEVTGTEPCEILEAISGDRGELVAGFGAGRLFLFFFGGDLGLAAGVGRPRWGDPVTDQALSVRFGEPGAGGGFFDAVAGGAETP